MRDNKHIPVGIYNREIFIAELENDGTIRGFEVLRPVAKSQLEHLRDMDERRDEYKSLWKSAVAAGTTEESLDDWLESIWDDELDESDDESYPGKDDSGLEYLSEEEREAADKYMAENEDMEIGTWESSGWYPPSIKRWDTDGEWKDRFKKWDFIFDDDEARRIAKDWRSLYEK